MESISNLRPGTWLWPSSKNELNKSINFIQWSRQPTKSEEGWRNIFGGSKRVEVRVERGRRRRNHAIAHPNKTLVEPTIGQYARTWSQSDPNWRPNWNENIASELELRDGCDCQADEIRRSIVPKHMAEVHSRRLCKTRKGWIIKCVTIKMKPKKISQWLTFTDGRDTCFKLSIRQTSDGPIAYSNQSMAWFTISWLGRDYYDIRWTCVFRGRMMTGSAIDFWNKEKIEYFFKIIILVIFLSLPLHTGCWPDHWPLGWQ